MLGLSSEHEECDNVDGDGAELHEKDPWPELSAKEANFSGSTNRNSAEPIAPSRMSGTPNTTLPPVRSTAHWEICQQCTGHV